MKHIFAFLFCALIIPFMYSETYHERAKKQGKEFHIYIRSSTGGYGATLHIGRGEDYILAFYSSGVRLFVNSITDNDEGLLVNYASLWVGAEEYLPTDHRSIWYNVLQIPKEMVEDAFLQCKDNSSFSINYRVPYEYTVVTFDDVEGSIRKGDAFHVKSNTMIRHP